MSKKLWVAYETHAKKLTDKVSIAGCSDAADFKGIIDNLKLKVAIRKSPELAIPQNTPITLYQPDGITEIDAGDSPAKYLKGNSTSNPLIVRIVEMAEESSIPKAVASVLHSKMTTGEKESILKEFIQSKEREVQSKEREVQSKEREVQSQVSLLEALKERMQRIEAERDFLKGTLDARHVFENYESKFPQPDPSAPRPTRAQRWKKHLELNPNIQKKLEECDKNIPWHNKATEIYNELCRNIHQRTIDIGNGKYLVQIENSLSKNSSCFVKVLAKELYGDNIVVQEDTVDEAAPKSEESVQEDMVDEAAPKSEKS